MEYINKEKVLEASLSFNADGSGTSTEKYHEVYYENKSYQVCDINLVDQQKTYGGSMNWTFNNSNKTLTAHFVNDEGEEKTLTTAVSLQNGVITLSSPEVTLKIQKK